MCSFLATSILFYFSLLFRLPLPSFVERFCGTGKIRREGRKVRQTVTGYGLTVYFPNLFEYTMGHNVIIYFTDKKKMKLNSNFDGRINYHGMYIYYSHHSRIYKISFVVRAEAEWSILTVDGRHLFSFSQGSSNRNMRYLFKTMTERATFSTF